MPTETVGIDKIKTLFDAGYTLGKKVVDDLKDNKISLMEGIGLIKPVRESIAIAKQWKEIKAQLLDMNMDEAVELEQYVMDKWQVPKPRVKSVIEHSLNQVISLMALVNEIKHVNDPVT